MKKTLITYLLLILLAPVASAQKNVDESMIKRNIGGFTHAGKENVDQSYNAGYSMYTAAWPLLKEYQGHNFQSGLFGTWMHPYHETKPTERLYSDIEGGLGWWRDTEYPTETPKFIMGGVELNFRGWANGPGAGQGRDWDNPKGKYGIAQLSPWILWPPDGLNLKQGTCGELFGSGYLPLPLTDVKSTTAGKNIKTGNQSWTLFINTANFKGPVAFFTPYFWSRVTVEKPELEGMFYDVLTSQANKQFSMETQHIHVVQATDSKGDTYVKSAITQYPVGPDGDSEILHQLMVYNKKALWDDVKTWFEGGDPVDGAINPKGSYMQKIKKGNGTNWKVWGGNEPKDKLSNMDTDAYMSSENSDSSTFRISWNNDLVKKRKHGSLVTLPEYYFLDKSVKEKNGKWIPISKKDVPSETGLKKVKFKRPNERAPKTYVTPEDAESCWKKPGPVAGPFKAKLGDGSTVTYYWYRFAEQPALLNADLSKEEREELQRRVVLLHRNWTKEREYLPVPMFGKLAEIDPALIVTPPKGMEVGYVPIVTQQGLE